MNVNQLSYKHEKDAPYFFKDLSFTLEKEKFHALHGKNGTGKSVLLSLLNKKVTPQSVMEGEIHRHGMTMLVNQRYDELLADKFSFSDNLKFACMKHFPSIKNSLKSPVFYLDFIKKFAIDITKPVYMLSGGQRQILALLMILQKPIKMLILDEPTASLDEENATLVFDFLKSLTTEGITILVVCHHPDLVSRYVTGKNLYLLKQPDGLRTLKTSTG